jgi:predicted nucleic acid-binding protein
MKIVVDTNIVFSAMLNTNSRISRIILQPYKNLTFYSTEKLLEEIDNHTDKLIDISGYTEAEYERIFRLITRKINFINIKLIPKVYYNQSVALTKDVDIDDTEFIALTEYINGQFYGVEIKSFAKVFLKKGGINSYLQKNFSKL